jgi:hypothetical protein
MTNPRGIKWKEHIYEEHNFRKMVSYIIYLLELPDNQCTFLERTVKEKIKSVDISFFEDLKVNQKVNRLMLATSDQSLNSPC